MKSIHHIFSSIHHTKQLNPQLTSRASRAMIYNWLSACAGKMEPFKATYALMDAWKASETNHNDKPQKQQSSLRKFQHYVVPT